MMIKKIEVLFELEKYDDYLIYLKAKILFAFSKSKQTLEFLQKALLKQLLSKIYIV